MLDLRRHALALSLPLLALALVAPVLAEESQPSKKEARLEEKEGVKVLVLTGSPREQGIQHGRAFAQDIVRAAGVLEKLRVARKKDLVTYREFQAHFKWTDDASAEIDGIVEGVKEKLGQVKVPGSDRDFARGDVEGINTICDLVPFACSSFTITGDRVVGGLTLTAR